MGDENQKRNGPDLARGVALVELDEGVPLLGYFESEPVLLVRRGEEVFAVGATCTHYNGPLAEGLVDGDTVRCPWHHACFSLRTGMPLRPPALQPVSCYTVERHDDTARVTGKRKPNVTRSVPPGRTATSPPASVLIVGAGPAGERAAETLRDEGYDGSIVVIDPDIDTPCDRPNLSKDFLAGNAPEEWIPLHPPEFYEAHGIQLVRARATRIDPHARRVELDDGSTHDYGGLILATGAEPVRLPPPAATGQSIYYLRTLADSRAIIAAARESARAVIIGASFIGLEVAASLRARGLEVHFIAPESCPLERILGAELGRFIRALHEEHGVIFHLGHTVRQITPDAVVLDDGTPLAPALIVAGIGVRPNIALAHAAGLTLDNGILVDEYLESSASGVYAVGDIARWPDPHTGDRIRVEHWVVAQRMGQTAARNILGARTRCDLVPFFWSQHYDVPINYVGHAEHWDRVTIDGSLAERSAAVRFSRGGRLLAVATVFRDSECLETEVAMERAPGTLRAAT